jgi:hypothetical protein
MKLPVRNDVTHGEPIDSNSLPHVDLLNDAAVEPLTSLSDQEDRIAEQSLQEEPGEVDTEISVSSSNVQRSGETESHRNSAVVVSNITEEEKARFLEFVRCWTGGSKRWENNCGVNDEQTCSRSKFGRTSKWVQMNLVEERLSYRQTKEISALSSAYDAAVSPPILAVRNTVTNSHLAIGELSRGYLTEEVYGNTVPYYNGGVNTSRVHERMTSNLSDGRRGSYQLFVHNRSFGSDNNAEAGGQFAKQVGSDRFGVVGDMPRNHGSFAIDSIIPSRRSGYGVSVM